MTSEIQIEIWAKSAEWTISGVPGVHKSPAFPPLVSEWLPLGKGGVSFNVGKKKYIVSIEQVKRGKHGRS